MKSKADKSVIAYSEKISYFFTSEEYDIYFFTAANRGYFDNSGLNFFPKRSGPEVIKLFSCSTQLSMKFFSLINVKMPTIVGI